MENTIEFEAEIKATKSKKLVSNDIEYSAILAGCNPAILQLGVIPPQTTVKVSITFSNDN